MAAISRIASTTPVVSAPIGRLTEQDTAAILYHVVTVAGRNTGHRVGDSTYDPTSQSWANLAQSR